MSLSSTRLAPQQSPRRSSYNTAPKSPGKGADRRAKASRGGLKQPSSRAETPVSDTSMSSGSRALRRAKQSKEQAGEPSTGAAKLDEPSSSALPAFEPVSDASKPVVGPRALPRRSKRPRSQHLAHLAMAATDSFANETDEERIAPAMANLSISAPSGSSKDVWEMPKQAAERKEALNWQQSLSAATPTAQARAPKKQTRPKSVALSDRSASVPPAPASAGDALTWQQELLRGTMPHSSSVGSAFDWPAAPSPRAGVNNSPVKQRRKKVSGETTQTAAMAASGSYEPFELDDDVFANNSTSSPKPGAKSARSGARSAPPAQHKGSMSSGAKTPSALEPARYAGPAFSNSPSPHLLPTPSRLTRRAEVQA